MVNILLWLARRVWLALQDELAFFLWMTYFVVILTVFGL